ncbi:MAG: hypothetical protein PHP99_05580, partial [Paludibacter sp.]|nr:hypothetical protein [Paludibacter sp.]
MEAYNKNEKVHHENSDRIAMIEKNNNVKSLPVIFRDGQKFVNMMKQLNNGGVAYSTPDYYFPLFKKEFEEEFESWITTINSLSETLKIESIEASKDLLQEFITIEQKKNVIDLYEYYYKLIDGLDKLGVKKQDKAQKQDKRFSEFISESINAQQRDTLIAKLSIWLDGRGGKDVADWIFALDDTKAIYFESREELIRAMKREFNIKGSKTENRSITKHLSPKNNEIKARTVRHREAIEQIKN